MKTELLAEAKRFAHKVKAKVKKKARKAQSKPSVTITTPPPKPQSPARVSSIYWDAPICAIATNGNFSPRTALSLGYKIVLLNLDDPDSIREQLPTYHTLGVVVGGWQRSHLRSSPYEEGRTMGQLCSSLGLAFLAPNLEDEYDTFGSYSSTPVGVEKLGRTVEFFRGVAASPAYALPKACMVTAHWAGNHDELKRNGCLLMPEAFYLEAPSATVTECARFATAPVGQGHNWNPKDVVCLVQGYPTNGQLPDPQRQVAEAQVAGVRIAPWAVEASLDHPEYARALGPAQ